KRAGDPRINSRGRLKGFDEFRRLVQAIAHEKITDKDGNPITLAERALRSWAESKEPVRKRFSSSMLLARCRTNLRRIRSKTKPPCSSIMRTSCQTGSNPMGTSIHARSSGHLWRGKKGTWTEIHVSPVRFRPQPYYE